MEDGEGIEMQTSQSTANIDDNPSTENQETVLRREISQNNMGLPPELHSMLATSDESVNDARGEDIHGEKCIFNYGMVKEFYNNKYIWRVLKGFLCILIALRVAHEFEFFNMPMKDYMPFGEAKWTNVKEYLNFQE